MEQIVLLATMKRFAKSVIKWLKYIRYVFINQEVICIIVDINEKSSSLEDDDSGLETECDSDYDIPQEMEKLSNLPAQTAPYIESPNIVYILL